MQRLQADLDTLRDKYLDDLVSADIGLKHKLSEIVWMEYFIKYQLDKVRPAEYINRYFMHLTVQEEFLQGAVYPDPKLMAVDEGNADQYRYWTGGKYQSSQSEHYRPNAGQFTGRGREPNCQRAFEVQGAI